MVINLHEMDFSFFANNWPYIVGGLVVIFAIYFTILAKISSAQKKAQQDEIRSRLKNPELNDKQKRLLTFGAILFAHRWEQITTIIPKDNIKMHIFGLKNQWGIVDSETAKVTIMDLLSLRKTAELDDLLHNGPKEKTGKEKLYAVMAQEEEIDVAKIKKQIAKDLKVDISEMDAVSSVYAWDIVRAASLAKWSFWCGYLSEDEMWEILEYCEKIATELGNDWKDFTLSFALGRTLHGFEWIDVLPKIRWLLNHDTIVDDEPNPYKLYKFKN